MHLVGRCNCGGVTLTLSGDVLVTGFCHCKTCQRQTASSGSLFVMVKESDLEIESTTLKKFVTKADSGSEVTRSFCGNCGSPIVSRSSRIPGRAIIKAGILDDTRQLQPAIELWCSEAQHWVRPLEATKRFDQGR